MILLAHAFIIASNISKNGIIQIEKTEVAGCAGGGWDEIFSWWDFYEPTLLAILGIRLVIIS